MFQVYNFTPFNRGVERVPGGVVRTEGKGILTKISNFQINLNKIFVYQSYQCNSHYNIIIFIEIYIISFYVVFT